MRIAVCALVACAVVAPAQAAPTPPKTNALQDIYQGGFKACAPAMEKMVRLIHPDDAAYANLGMWSMDKTDSQMATAVTSERLEGGHAVTTFSAVKTAAGSCDVSVTYVETDLAEACAHVRENAYKAWKYVGDFNDATIYQDPTTPNSKLVLTPAGSGCLIVKSIVGYGL
jgi:hypothetical protein